MNKPLLICMVGLPRSGKSTWSRAQGLPVVNRDAVRLALHGQRFLSEAEDMVASMTRYMVKALFLGGHRTVILDECNVTAKQREQWFSDECDTVFQYINTPKEECLRRAAETNDTVIVPVIERMAAEMDWVPVYRDVETRLVNCFIEELGLSRGDFTQFAWEVEYLTGVPCFTKCCSMGECEFGGATIKREDR